MTEIKPEETAPGKSSPRAKPVTLTEIDNLEIQREITGLEEFDRVLGGGLVPDSIILIGGESGLRVTVEEHAEIAGTISHEIVTGISGRVSRVFLPSS